MLRKIYKYIYIPFWACRRAKPVVMGICSVQKCVRDGVH